MADNTSLGTAKKQQKDEFYTQYSDIEAEMNAYVEYNPDVFRDKTILLPCDDPEWSEFTRYFASNFERFGLKKLISTSYAKGAGNRQLTLFEIESPLYDEDKHKSNGKLFTLTRDKDNSGCIDTDDIEFSGYLKGDGDYRSEEVCKLRDEADIIITNPPFSLFRDFLNWILEAGKQFVIIGNQNAITTKDVFPLLMKNEIWLGQGFKNNVGYFYAPDYDDYAVAGQHKEGFIRVSGVMWFTNIDLGKRHEPLLLDTMEHNLKFNKQLRKKFKEDYESSEYPHYDNYKAIEVPFTECIPSDYDKVMGVPITFLDKYNPEQFDILGVTQSWDDSRCKRYPKQIQISKDGKKSRVTKLNDGPAIKIHTPPIGKTYYIVEDELFTKAYARILIRRKEISK